MFRATRTGCVTVSFLFCFPAASAAQGSADGQVAVGSITSDSLPTGYIFGDLTLQAREGQWGAELGMFGVVGRLHETYAAVTWQRDDHKFELGFPRPAFDRYAISGPTPILLSAGHVDAIPVKACGWTSALRPFRKLMP